MYTFREYLFEKRYQHEQEILSQLPSMDIVKQIETDIALHNSAIEKGTFGHASSELAQDNAWKYKLLNIVSGQEKNPVVIHQVIDVIKNDMQSHQNRQSTPDTGSQDWHSMWLSVYGQWLHKLEQILGALNGTKSYDGKYQ